MRDLEIRGAGNLLGSQQSGHIAAVGYELYCSLLEDAVRQAQNLPPKLSADVDIDLPVEACLPPDYVADLRHKIDLYRRIGKIDHLDQIREIADELRDRFGPLPPPAIRMLKLAELRLDAAVWQIASIQSEPRFMILNYGDRRRIELLAKRSPIDVRVVDAKRAYVPTEGFDIADPSGRGWLELAKLVFSGQIGTGTEGRDGAGTQDGAEGGRPPGKAVRRDEPVKVPSVTAKGGSRNLGSVRGVASDDETSPSVPKRSATPIKGPLRPPQRRPSDLRDRTDLPPPLSVLSRGKGKRGDGGEGKGEADPHAN
jgi:hypothetical protein